VLAHDQASQGTYHHERITKNVLLVETRVGPSRVAGKGLFAMTDIPCGAIVGDFVYKCELLTEEEYEEAQRNGDRLVLRRAVRSVGPRFVYGTWSTEGAPPAFLNEDYMNHSENPNLLYHCGILFARREITAGEELTADYKYLLGVDDATSFVDTETGKRISGLVSTEALRQSTHELLALLPFIGEESWPQPQPAVLEDPQHDTNILHHTN
jgi:hypothetical protein